jgi:hypothetical protein
MTLKYYQELLTFLNNKSCKMLTTYQDFFNNTNKYKKISIISSCGHESHNIYCHVLKNRNTGIICKNCIIDKAKNYNKNNKDFDTLKYESDSFNILFSNTKNIIIKKTDEGCNSDLIIKPKNISDDLWLPIQVKSTNCLHNNCYSFSFCKNKYNNNIIILIYIPDRIVWILDNNIVKNNSKISIGINKSKYDIYKVNLNEIDKILFRFYNDYKHYHNSFTTINKPISINQQLEQKHKINRENKLNFLNFEYPTQNQLVYDFKINNFKIQEKVASKRINRNAYAVILAKKIGNHKLSCYNKNDNDFYWINIPNFKFFILIPENILIEKNIINNSNNKKKNIYIKKTIHIDNWLFPYVFSYNNPDKQKLLKMFLLQ